MSTLLIGLCGKAEHGKTAAARIIKEYVELDGATCGIFEISALILQECIELGLLPPGTVRDGKDKVQNKILVDHGSARRKENPNYWTDLVVKSMEESGLDVAICPNVRFPQEGGAIQAKGGTVWRINRLNEDASPFISDTRDPNDPCETSLDKWAANFFITNITGHGPLLEKLVIAVLEYVLALEGAKDE